MSLSLATHNNIDTRAIHVQCISLYTFTYVLITASVSQMDVQHALPQKRIQIHYLVSTITVGREFSVVKFSKLILLYNAAFAK